MSTRRRNKGTHASSPGTGSGDEDEGRGHRRTRCDLHKGGLAMVLLGSVLVFFYFMDPATNNTLLDTASGRKPADISVMRPQGSNQGVVIGSPNHVPPPPAAGGGPAAAQEIYLVQKQQPPSQGYNIAKDTAVHVLNESLPPQVKITPLSDPLETCESTIVTGYFNIRSKFAPEKYLGWMKNFLSVQDCLVIFSSAEMMDNMKALRQHVPARTVLIELGIHDLPIAKLHGDSDPEFWQKQLDMDYEKKHHQSFALFWIWLSKTWCVRQAIEKNFFHSNIFMWQDIGSYRNPTYNGKSIMQHTELIPPKTLLWMAHHPPNAPPDPIWNDKRRQGQYYFHSGSQSAGDKEAWIEFHEHFAETMDMFLERNMFIGEDQCVLQSTCQRYPDLCAYVRAGEVKDNHYFGLRYLLVNGGKYNLWRMPGAKTTITR